MKSHEKKESKAQEKKENLAKKMKGDDKKIQLFKEIKDHVSGGKKSGGFKDPFWYSK